MNIAKTIIEALNITENSFDGEVSVHKLVTRMLTFVIEQTPAAWTTYRNYDKRASVLRYSAFIGKPSPPNYVLEEVFSISNPTESNGAYVFRTQEPFYCADTQEPPLPGKPRHACKFSTRSCITSPVSVLRSRHGVISADSPNPDAFTREHQEFVSVIGTLLAVSIDLVNKERERNELIGTIAHQTISPLSGIMGYGINLANKVYRSSDREELVYNIIVEQAERAVRSARTMLSMSELLLLGSEEVEGAPIDIYTIFVDVAKMFQGEAKLRGISVSVWEDKFEHRTWRIDERLFREAAATIIDNAIKYSDDNMLVQVSAVITSKWFKIRIINYGIPLDGSELEQILERGPQSRTSAAIGRVPQGTGIGLWVARRVLEIHGGKVIANKTNSKNETVIDMCIPLYRKCEKYIISEMRI